LGRETGLIDLLRSPESQSRQNSWPVKSAHVLKGEMSLVGPRPLLMKYLDRYTPEQARRHEVKPEITGWAQVNGRNAISWEEKFNLDVWYVNNVSFWLDAKMIALTIWKIVKREGITQPGHATAEEFMGSHAKTPRR
jgi:sugar transferase EpsL